MPNSALTSGVPLYPRQAIPGVKAIFVSQITNLSGSVLTNGTGSVTSIPFAVGSGSQFFQYNFPPDTAKWEQGGAAEQANGAVKVEQSVSFELPWYQLTTRNQIKQLAQVDCLVIVENADSNYYLFGATRGMTLTEFKSDSGLKLGDFSGWKMQFKGSEPEEAFYVTGSLMPALLLPS